MYYEPISFRPEEIVQYLRKSRSDDPYLSVDEVLARHETILREWTERNLEGPVPEENIFREVVSGETIKDRPEFLRLLRIIESPSIKAILVVEVQRLSRGDLEDAGRLMKILRWTHTQVITPQKIYDLDNEYDRDFFERELKRGNEFLEYTKKILNRGREFSVSQGHYIASVPIYGTDKCWVQEGKKKYPTLKENDKMSIVRSIFFKFTKERLSPYAIGQYLDSIGEPAPKGEHWSYRTIIDILKNPHYDKKVFWGKRAMEHKIVDGKVVSCRPRKKGYQIYEGKQPRFIDHGIFLEAQELLKQSARTRHDYEAVNPFAGLVFCRTCGRSISYRTYKRNGKEQCLPRMICSDQIHCKTASCCFSEFSDAVQEVLRKTIAEFEVVLSSNAFEQSALYENHIKTLENRLQEIEKKELRQWEKYADGEMPKEIFEQLHTRLMENKKTVLGSLERLRAEAPQTPVELQKKLARLSDALNALNDGTVPVSLKNEYLRTVIERIEYYRPAAVRERPAADSMKLRGGWYTPPFELDVRLKL